jgi:hypothetical protein
MYLPILARRQLGKKVTAAANTHATIEEIWTRRFLYDPCCVKESRWLVPPRTSCYLRVMYLYIFWDIPPCSHLKVNRRFGGTCWLHLPGRRISQARNQREAGSMNSSLKMEAIYSSATSVQIQRTTRRYIPEDRTLHNHRCENLRSYTALYPKKTELFINTVVRTSDPTRRYIPRRQNSS